MALASQKKLESVTFLDPAKGHGSLAVALELAVAEAEPGTNIVYAASVPNLAGYNDVRDKAWALCTRELVDLTTMKVSLNPPRYHYVVQRTKKPYARPGKGGGK